MYEKPFFIPSQKTTDRIVLFVCWLFVGSGIALFSLAAQEHLNQRDFLSHAEHVTGTIVGFNEAVRIGNVNRSPGPISFFKPIFAFSDHFGVVRRITAKEERRGQPGYRIGENLPVLYRTDDPRIAQIDSFDSFWGYVTRHAHFGAGLCLLGGVPIYAHAHERRRRLTRAAT